MHKPDEGYRQRAIECLAFAENARSQEERSQLLIMAKILERLALAKEQKEQKEKKGRNSERRGAP